MFTTSLKTFLLKADHLEVPVEKTPLFVLTVQPKDRVTKEDLQEITVITHQELEVVIRLEVLQLEIIVHEEVLQLEVAALLVEVVLQEAVVHQEVALRKEEDKILIKLL
jgi:hypothetical protein